MEAIAQVRRQEVTSERVQRSGWEQWRWPAAVHRVLCIEQSGRVTMYYKNWACSAKYKELLANYLLLPPLVYDHLT